MHEGSNDIHAARMIMIHLILHRTTKLKQTSSMVSVDHARTKKCSRCSRCLRTPNLKLKQAISSGTVSLSKEQIVFRFSIDM